MWSITQRDQRALWLNETKLLIAHLQPGKFDSHSHLGSRYIKILACKVISKENVIIYG